MQFYFISSINFIHHIQQKHILHFGQLEKFLYVVMTFRLTFCCFAIADVRDGCGRIQAIKSITWEILSESGSYEVFSKAKTLNLADLRGFEEKVCAIECIHLAIYVV